MSKRTKLIYKEARSNEYGELVRMDSSSTTGFVAFDPQSVTYVEINSVQKEETGIGGVHYAQQEGKKAKSKRDHPLGDMFVIFLEVVHHDCDWSFEDAEGAINAEQKEVEK